MSNDPYAAPTANLENVADAAVIPTKTLSAKGRLSVLSYLAHSMILVLIMLVVFAVLAGIGALIGGISPESLMSPESIDFSNPILIALAVVAVIAYIAMSVIIIIMMIKRIHDRNHSGWWILALYIALLIPFVNFVAFFAFLYVTLFPGQKTGNRFGGRRPTKGWEKVLGILYIVLIIGVILTTVSVPMMMMGAS